MSFVQANFTTMDSSCLFNFFQVEMRTLRPPLGIAIFFFFISFYSTKLISIVLTLIFPDLSMFFPLFFFFYEKYPLSRMQANDVTSLQVGELVFREL